MEQEKQLFTEKDIIYSYTDEQAIEDGILIDLSVINPDWKRGIINLITNNLAMEFQILKEDKATGGVKFNIPNLLDVLNQSVQIIKKSVPDTFYSGTIEVFDGTKRKVFIGQNGSGAFTLMLPKDY